MEEPGKPPPTVPITDYAMSSKFKGPLCKVCNDEASGFHYGVDSCEGCKLSLPNPLKPGVKLRTKMQLEQRRQAMLQLHLSYQQLYCLIRCDLIRGFMGFFRRCITQGMTHRCNNDEKCEITPFSRNSCQYCRLKKCFVVGMSREASRLGRRPKRLKEAMAMEYSKGYGPERGGVGDPFQLAMPPILPLAQISQVTGLSEEQLRNMTMGDLQNLLQKINSQRSSRGGGPSHNMPSSSGGSSMPPQQIPPQHSSVMRQPPMLSGGPSHQPYGPGHQPHGRVPDPHNPDMLYNHGSHNYTDRMKMENKYCSQQSQDNPKSVDSESGYSSYEAGSDTPSSQKSWSPVTGNSGYNIKVKSEQEDNSCSLGKHKTFCEENRSSQPPSSSTSSYSDNSSKSWPSPDQSCSLMRRQSSGCTSATSPPASTFHAHSPTNPYDAQDSPKIPDVQAPNVPSRFSPASIDHSPFSSNSLPDIASPTSQLLDQDCEAAPVKKAKTSGPELTLLSLINKEEELKPFTIKSMDTRQLEELIQNAQVTPSAARMKLIDQVIDTIVEAHLETCNYTSEKVSKAMEEYRKKCVDGKEPTRLDDVPGGAMLTWGSEFVANMAPVIMRVVKFCKRLPGFRELAEDDQIRLIKQGSFEVMLVRYTVLFQEDQMFVPSMTFKVSRAMIKSMPLGDFFDQQFMFAGVFNKLELTDGENALLTAILIFNSNRIDLSNPLAVKMIQVLLAQAFYTYLIRSRGDEGHAHFLKVMDIMPLLWGINEVHSKRLNDMKMKMPELMNQFPNIHKEMFNS